MSTTSPGGSDLISASTCCSIRETVSVENRLIQVGRIAIRIPCAASRSAKKIAFEDSGDEAKPWR